LRCDGIGDPVGTKNHIRSYLSSKNNDLVDIQR
jgi:hypothetical protein